MTAKRQQLLFGLLQWSVICVLVGRAYQHIFWDAPYRSLLWDEAWMGGLVQSLLKMDWQTYSTSLEVDDTIQRGIQLVGYGYLLGALVALFIRRLPRWVHYWLVVCGLSLVFLAALYCKEKFFSLGQFFEYSLQFSSPLLLFFGINTDTENTDNQYLKPFVFESWFHFVLKIGIALTFTCHGLYAVNYYPLPGHFMDMTMNILGVGDAAARQFLRVAGVLDFVMSVLLFVPKRGVVQAALAYAVLWGFLTAAARVVAHFYWAFPAASLHQWWFESVYRFCHFLLPLFLLLMLKFQKTDK